MTNYENIIKMSIEELSKFLTSFSLCDICSMNGGEECYRKTNDCKPEYLIDWLNKENIK